MSPHYQLAIAAGHDAGNRSMTAAGRRKWSLQDHRAASKVFHAIYNRTQKPVTSKGNSK